MRCVIALALVAGCGRIAFDPIDRAGGDGGGSGSDGGGSPTYYVISGDGSGPTELLTIDLATGQVTVLGTVSASFGVLGGLAYWDASTLYASTTGSIIRITLAPVSAAMSGVIAGTYSALERDGSALLGIDQDADTIAHFQPDGSMVMGRQLTIDALGGDLASNGGVWYWYSNNTSQLYTVTTTANAVPVGSATPSIPFVGGMVFDDAGNLFYLCGDTDELIAIDRTTGAELRRVPIGHDIKSGDVTRSP